MIKKITLTEEHLALIQNIRFEAFEFEPSSVNSRFGWGIDQYSLFGGTYFLEDASRILGCYDQHIPGTEEDPLGPDFPEELKNHLWGLYDYIWGNIEYILSLVLFYSSNGGLKPGTYKCKSTEKIWTRVEED